MSRIQNDENLLFLGVPFVNDPTIEFPDYALGVALEGPLPRTESMTVGAVLSSSHGLADNPAVSYAQLLSVSEPDKGVFAGLTTRWVGDGRRLSLSGRVGLANGDVSVARLFTGLTYLWARQPDVVVVAVGRSATSTDAPEVAHAELFVRRRLLGDVFITGSL